MKLALLSAAALFLLPASAKETASLDANASFLKFTGHAFLHNFDGQARHFSGKAEIDPANPWLVDSAEVAVPAADMTTFEETRDRNMRTWLHVDAHPEIHFHLARVILLSGDAARATANRPASFAVAGDFWLNGRKRPLTAHAQGWHERGTLVVTGTTTLDTLAYGLPIIRQLFMTVDRQVDVAFRLVFDLPPDLAK